MKKMLNVLALVLAINFLALGGAVGWLWKSHHLDGPKATAIKELLFPRPTTGPTTEPDAAPTTRAAEPDPLAELLARHAGKRTGEQVEAIQQSFDVESAQLDRRRQELESLADQVAREQKQLADKAADLDRSRQQLAQREKQDQSQADDRGFQETLKLYSALPATQVKKIFVTLPTDTVVNYLQAMPPQTASKVLKEFKSPTDVQLLQTILEKMRRAGQPNPVNSGGRAAAPNAGEENSPVQPKEKNGVIGPAASQLGNAGP